MAFRRQEDTADSFVLQTARSLDRGPLCMTATSNLKQALLHAVRNPSTVRPPGGADDPMAAKYSVPNDSATWLAQREAS